MSTESISPICSESEEGRKGEEMSESSKQQKQQVIDEIKEKLDGAKGAVVIDYMGISVAETEVMRRALREADVDYTVYKNTLMKRAVEGTEFEPLTDVLMGPSALAISKEDATLPARILNKSIKDFKKMEFKAGVIEGQYYDKEGIKAIASIPSKEELLAKFMGSIKSPISTFVRTLAALAEEKAKNPEKFEEVKAEAEKPEAVEAETPAEAEKAENAAE